jgi:hypothetical protein
MWKRNDSIKVLLILAVILTAVKANAGFCDRITKKIAQIAAFKKSNDGILWYWDPAYGNERTIDLTRIFSKTPENLEFIRETPLIAPFWKIISYLGPKAKWSNDSKGSGPSGSAENTVLGTHVDVVFPNKGEMAVSITVYHEDEVWEEQINDQIKRAVETVNKKNPTFTVTFQNFDGSYKNTIGQVVKARATTLNLQRKFSTTDNVRFFERLTADMAYSPLNIVGKRDRGPITLYMNE